MGRNRLSHAQQRKRKAPQKRDRTTGGGQGPPPKPALVWANEAWQDYLWFAQHKPALRERINRLVEEIQKTPFTGIGKPEPLRHELAGYWSRRIDHEHRLVYRPAENEIRIAQCRFHYSPKKRKK
ncbi:MAG: Txe/YoeB family addiction module toxin [Burkholderiales bacterium]